MTFSKANDGGFSLYDPQTSPYGNPSGFATTTSTTPTANSTPMTGSGYYQGQAAEPSAQQGGFFGETQFPQGQPGGFVGGTPFNNNRGDGGCTHKTKMRVMWVCLALIAIGFVVMVVLMVGGSPRSSSSSSSRRSSSGSREELKCKKDYDGEYRCRYETVYYDMSQGGNGNGSYGNSTAG